jgi:hypothetical protein
LRTTLIMQRKYHGDRARSSDVPASSYQYQRNGLCRPDITSPLAQFARQMSASVIRHFTTIIKEQRITLR